MGRFASLLVGGVVGAAAAFLFTPRNGAENRAAIAEKISAGTGKLPAEVHERAASAVSAVAAGSTVAINTVVDNGSDAIKAVKSKVQSAPSVVEQAAAPALSEADDLREKIDAARERIAAQVAKNAEAIQDAAVDKVPGAIDAALDAKATAAAAAATAQETIADTASALKDRIAATTGQHAKPQSGNADSE